MPSFKKQWILASAALAVVAVPVWAQSDSGYYEQHSFDISPVPIQPVVTSPRWAPSSIGGCQPIEPRSTEAALASSAARVQRAVGSETRLKFTPKLVFSVDPSIKHGDRIDQILRDIETDDPEEPS